MQILKVGEVSTKSTVANVDANFVECSHATVHDSLKDSGRFQMDWSLNFENVTQAEIMEAAAEHWVIKIRRDFAKDSDPQDVDWNDAQFDVKKYVSKRISKTEKLAKALADFSDEQLAALGLTRSESE